MLLEGILVLCWTWSLVPFFGTPYLFLRVVVLCMEFGSSPLIKKNCILCGIYVVSSDLGTTPFEGGGNI